MHKEEVVLAMEYVFRKATIADFNDIMTIIEDAKKQMLQEGKDQWNDAYPNREHIEADIKETYAYVLQHNGKLLAYGAVMFTEEPAYNHIHDGQWLSSLPYVVLHRFAVSKQARGQGIGALFMQNVEQLSRDKNIYSFKADTNYDNERMLHMFDKMGFTYCGKISYPQGERMAFEKLLNK